MTQIGVGAVGVRESVWNPDYGSIYMSKLCPATFCSPRLAIDTRLGTYLICVIGDVHLMA